MWKYPLSFLSLRLIPNLKRLYKVDNKRSHHFTWIKSFRLNYVVYNLVVCVCEYFVEILRRNLIMLSTIMAYATGLRLQYSFFFSSFKHSIKLNNNMNFHLIKIINARTWRMRASILNELLDAPDKIWYYAMTHAFSLYLCLCCSNVSFFAKFSWKTQQTKLKIKTHNSTTTIHSNA